MTAIFRGTGNLTRCYCIRNDSIGLEFIKPFQFVMHAENIPRLEAFDHRCVHSIAKIE